MAIDMVQDVFPGADVAWERTPRVKPERSLVLLENSGREIANVLQEHISDDYRGPGVDELSAALIKIKSEAQQ